MIFHFIDENFKDKVDRNEALTVMEEGILIELVPSRDGNNRAMFVWETAPFRVIEIGVEYLSTTEAIVFHGMKATKQNERILREGEQ